ncbi:transmembrane protein 35B isoform X2 [Mesocricetus auratus]|uniref:Transmembrane protein 35B isoform X2 n=1 Tax=Mesocricetus auratus TaxID=10036 RepID=A0ABM2YCK1_MESAU|nr:transmembrane protein 35B isoform X2 [Mesocricetus auratus]
MALLVGTLRLLLGGFFTLAGAAKLLQVSAPVSQQMGCGLAVYHGGGGYDSKTTQLLAKKPSRNRKTDITVSYSPSGAHCQRPKDLQPDPITMRFHHLLCESASLYCVSS